MSLFSRPKAFGLDLSDNTLHLLEVKGRNSEDVTSSIHLELPSGLIADGNIMDQAALVEHIRTAYAEAQPHRPRTNHVVSALPETYIYTHHFRISRDVSKKDLLDAVYKQAEVTIPINLDEAAWDFEVLTETEEGKEVLFAAAPAEVVELYEQTLILAGFDLKILELESMALSRALTPLEPELLSPLAKRGKELLSPLAKGGDRGVDESVAILDIGGRVSNLVFLNASGIQLAVSSPVAGNALTEALSGEFKLKIDQAEKQKRSKGLTDPKLAKVISKTLKSLLNEFNEARTFCERKVNKKIKKVVLAGGSSALPGLTEELQKVLGIEVLLGAPPFQAASYAPYQIATVSGLALRARDLSPGINFIASA